MHRHLDKKLRPYVQFGSSVKPVADAEARSWLIIHALGRQWQIKRTYLGNGRDDQLPAVASVLDEKIDSKFT